MASLYRLASSTLRDVAPRRTLATPFSHSAVRSSTALSTPPVPAVFDIFDAPVRLRERHITDERSIESFYAASPTRATPTAGPSYSKSIYSDALGLPYSLPPPVTFDGPARPPHMSLSSLKKRRLQRQNSVPSRSAHESTAVSFSTFRPQTEPVYRIFDGPSRITRYPYPTSQNERSFTYVSLALCLSSAFGWLVFQDSLDLNKKHG